MNKTEQNRTKSVANPKKEPNSLTRGKNSAAAPRKLNRLNCMYVNAQSLCGDSKAVKAEMLLSNYDIHVFFVTETWMSTGKNIEIAGYKLVAKFDKKKKGQPDGGMGYWGGVGV